MSVEKTADSILRNLSKEHQQKLLMGIMVAINRRNTSNNFSDKNCVERIEYLMNLGADLAELGSQMNQAAD